MIRCNFFAKNSAKGVQSQLKVLKFRRALNPLRRIFLNFAKSCSLSCSLQFDNKKWGSLSSVLNYKRLKLKLRVFLACHIVAMATYCVTKMMPTCSPIIGQFFDTMIVASIDKNRSAMRTCVGFHSSLIRFE